MVSIYDISDRYQVREELGRRGGPSAMSASPWNAGVCAYTKCRWKQFEAVAVFTGGKNLHDSIFLGFVYFLLWTDKWTLYPYQQVR
jgi:hypothetical protein